MMLMGFLRRTAMPPAVRRVSASAVAAIVAGTLIATSADAVNSAGDDPAARKRTVDQQLKDLKADLSETSADLAAAYTALAKTQAQIPVAQAALDDAQSRASAAAAAHARAKQRLEVARASEAKAEKQLDETRKKIVSSRSDLARLAGSLYQSSGVGEMDIVLGATSPQEFADRLVLGSTLMDVQRATVDRLATDRASQAALEDRLSALRAEAADAEQEAKVTLQEATAARDAAAAAKAALDSLAATQAQQAAAVKGKLNRERTRADALASESKELGAQLAEIARKRREEAERKRREWERTHKNQPPPPTSQGPMLWPTAGGVSSGFGMRYHPILNYWRLHAGVDIGGTCGQPIYAAAAGVVVEARVTSGSGLRLVVDHGVMRGVGLATTYNHLSRFAVTRGSVKRGQVIGYVGNTGLSTACHLHFETYENGTPVDPMRWL